MLTRLIACLTFVSVLASAAAIQFDNRSGSPAEVKVVGKSVVTVSVPDRATNGASVAPGEYYVIVRYGTVGRYRYSRGESFVIRDSERVSITLHKVAGGNYRTAPTNAGSYAAPR